MFVATALTLFSTICTEHTRTYDLGARSQDRGSSVPIIMIFNHGIVQLLSTRSTFRFDTIVQPNEYNLKQWNLDISKLNF